MTSGPNIKENLANVEKHIRKAADCGAQLVLTPENTCHIRHPAEKKLNTVQAMEEHEAVPFFSNLAKELEIVLLIGSMTVKQEDQLMNRSFLFAPDGVLKTTYDKIHLFDVQLANGESYRESDIYGAGERAVVASVNNIFSLGFSICYDIRFPNLFRDLAKAGANILCVPAAFTVPTGQAHWETLLRARAIETGSYVLACGQVGEHENGRKTYGHSMIISPWGDVLECIEHEEGIIIADLDINAVSEARESIPSLSHDRTYKLESI